MKKTLESCFFVAMQALFYARPFHSSCSEMRFLTENPSEESITESKSQSIHEFRTHALILFSCRLHLNNPLIILERLCHQTCGDGRGDALIYSDFENAAPTAFMFSIHNSEERQFCEYASFALDNNNITY